MSAATKRALQRQCDAFNASAPVGTRVAVRNDRGGVVQTVTRSRAEVLGGHSAVIWLEGISGCYSLDRVTLYDGPPAEDTAEDRARQALAKAYIDAGKPGTGEYIGLGNLFMPDQPIWIAAMLAFATAEAARGAGEREGWTFTPDTHEAQAVAQLSEEQELSPQAVVRQALRLYQADFFRRKAGETVTWSGDEQRARDFAGPLASLPPANAPTMGLDPVTVGRCAALCDELATKCRAELKDPSNDVATISAFHGCLGACETLAASIRAAATPVGDAA